MARAELNLCVYALLMFFGPSVRVFSSFFSALLQVSSDKRAVADILKLVLETRWCMTSLPSAP